MIEENTQDALRLNVELDAERYRRLAWLVEFGCWSIAHHEIIDSYGSVKETYMDDKADMDAWLDKPEIIADAKACAGALQAANVKLRGCALLRSPA